MKSGFFGQRPGLLFVVSGPAGSGKGTVMNLLVKSGEDFALSVSATTRAPGKNERDGVEYHFVTRDRFEEMIANGELLEHAEYVGNYYGTPKAPALEVLGSGRHLLLEIEVDGAAQIKKAYPQAVLIMIIPPGAAEQERRLRSRGRDSEESILRRLERARTELDRVSLYDYVLINETGQAEATAAAIRSIAEAEMNSVGRLGNVAKVYFDS